METEVRDLREETLNQIAICAAILETADDTDVRVKETGNLKKLIEALMEQEKQSSSMTYQYDRMESDNKLEEARFEIEKKKAKHDIAVMWADIGIRALAVGLTAGLGWAGLVFNMKNGGMQGKDGLSYVKEIKNWARHI